MLNRLKKLFRSGAATPAAAAPSAGAAGDEGNPSKGSQFTISVRSVANPSDERTESINLVIELHKAFTRAGRHCSVRDGAVHDAATGASFSPGIVSFQPQENDLSLQMCTTIEVHQPDLFPRPFFEFQHSRGDTAALSVARGFDDWMELDLPAIEDALRQEPPDRTSLEMTLPDGTGRRVIFGPVKRWGNPIPAESGGDEEGHPPFCSCCLFTQCGEAFRPLIEARDVFAIRLYAMREADGSAGADCRVNGLDFPAGRDALLEYVRKWPGDDFEARKQYVIVQNKPAAD